MNTPSKPVCSNQPDVHPHLDALVRRHLEASWKKPLHASSRPVFEQLQAWLSGGGRAPIILDSGCGTGQSTGRLAARYPGHRVIGIDKSAHRLARAAPVPDNALLVRAELGDLWRLMAAADWRLDQHWILYPNPWPKAAHIMRRWHGHPAFPALLALGGRLVLRSNWRLYLEEFSRALVVAGRPGGVIMGIHDPEALTPFEFKYRASRHALFELSVQLEE